MELLPKKKPIFLKVVYSLILLVLVMSGIMGLYGYLWNSLRTTVAKSIAKDFYLEGTQVACTLNSDCVDACRKDGELVRDEACVCLKNMCHYLKGVQYFSQAKFCEQDSDCMVSCFEGPVSTTYFDKADGVQKDCSGGCADTSFLQTDGKSNAAVCRNRQCQYRDGRTCYTNVIPGSSL